MANRTKAPHKRSGSSIAVRCSPEFKAQVSEMFAQRSDGDYALGISEVVRKFLQKEINDWKKNQSKGAQ